MTQRWFLITLSLVQGGLLLFRIGRQSLWLDEVMSLDVARSPWPQFFSFFRYLPEQHPLYYLILRNWLVFGTSEASLRMLSAVFAVATLWAFYHLAERLFDEDIARIASVLLCFSPFYLYYGQEARMYTLLCFLAVVGSLLLVRWLDSDSRMDLVAYIAVGVLGAYTHLFFFFLLAAHWTFVMAYRRRRHRRTLTVAHLLVAAAYLPWVALILARGPSSQTWKGVGHIVFGIPYTLLRFSLGYSQLLANHGWKERLGALLWENVWILSAALICFGIIGVAGIIKLMRAERSGGFVLICMVLPMVLALLVSFKVIVVGERYFIVSFPFYLLTLAVGWRAISRARDLMRRIGVVCVGLYIAIAVKCLGDYYFDPRFGKEQWAAVAGYIREHSERPEVVVVHSGYAVKPLRYYYDEVAPVQLKRSEDVSPEYLAALPRYWLVLAHATNETAYRATLPSTHAPALEQFFPKETGIRVLLLVRRNNYDTSY